MFPARAVRTCGVAFSLVLAFSCALGTALAWDYETHRLINQLALASLPTNFPAFMSSPAAAERLGFLAGEPDRWRNTQDLPLKHLNNPDHYIDVEELALYDMQPEMLPVFRYDFVAQLALFRKSHPDRFAAHDLGRNEDHTRQLVGLLPWAIVEGYAKVKSGFSCLQAYEQDGGRPEEIENAQANLLYVMGTLGHLVGDAAQPLHTTVHHHGWVGHNPNGYSTNRNIHSWVDGGFLARSGPMRVDELRQKLRPARLLTINGQQARQEEYFQATMLFLVEQNQTVETLYQLDKAGKLFGPANNSQEGRKFLEAQVLKAAQCLGDLWFSAWSSAPPDTFLKGQLAKRSKR